MRHERPEPSSKMLPDSCEITPEDALVEEIRQLRAAIKIYRDLVERLLQERQERT